MSKLNSIAKRLEVTAVVPMKIRWFRDYHEIYTAEARGRKSNPKYRLTEVNPEDFGMEYTGAKGGLDYPALQYEAGSKPTEKILRAAIIKSASQHGFSRATED